MDGRVPRTLSQSERNSTPPSSLFLTVVVSCSVEVLLIVCEGEHFREAVPLEREVESLRGGVD